MWTTPLAVWLVQHQSTFVCSKHFVDPSGPTVEFPDPLPADGSKLKKTRLHWKLRHDGKSESTNPDGNAVASVVEETVGMTVTESETDCQQLPIATGDSLKLLTAAAHILADIVNISRMYYR
ncbi:uncharacterized protein LOC111100014 [Crassostrea virginica]